MTDIVKVDEDNLIDLVPNNTKYQQVEDELDEIKANLLAISEKIEPSLATLIALAEASQNPKVYEALALITKSLIDSNKEAGVVVEKKIKLYESLSKGKEAVNNNTYNDNRTVVMTTSELIEKIKKNKSE